MYHTTKELQSLWLSLWAYPITLWELEGKWFDYFNGYMVDYRRPETVVIVSASGKEPEPVEFTKEYQFTTARFRAFVEAFRKQGVALTDRALTTQTGIPRQTIRKLYSGRTKTIYRPHWESIKQVAKAYRIEIGGLSL